MRKLLLLSAAAALLAAGLTGCRKENGIDNNQVIQRPYSLFFSDVDGALYKTNTGDTFDIVFPPDGVADRSIVTSGNNILWLKNNIFLSQDNGKAFNPSFRYPQDRSVANWQPAMLNVPDQNRVYLAALNLLGGDVAYSEDNGKTWIPDTMWIAGTRPSGTFIASFAQLSNGFLFAHDYINARFYVRYAKAGRWGGFKPASLPPSQYFLSHVGNNLLAVDYSGAQGVWYSNDSATRWTKYNGLPAGQQLLCANAPFDQAILVGTDSMGVYRLDKSSGAFVPSSIGLDPFTSVRGIVGKNDIYKNGNDYRYVYIATSTGIYMSGDLGANWVKVKQGNYSRIY